MVPRTRTWRPRRHRTPSVSFNLLELLVVVVTLGVLAAIVVARLRGMTEKGSHAACLASKSAAENAAFAYYATPDNDSGWPDAWSDLIEGTEPSLLLRGGVSSDSHDPSHTVVGHGWTLTLSGGGRTPTTFACS